MAEKINENKKRAIKYLTETMANTLNDINEYDNPDRDIIIDFIKYPKETSLFSRYQKNIYLELAEKFNLPPIKLDTTSQSMWILA